MYTGDPHGQGCAYLRLLFPAFGLRIMYIRMHMIMQQKQQTGIADDQRLRMCVESLKNFDAVHAYMH